MRPTGSISVGWGIFVPQICQGDLRHPAGLQAGDRSTDRRRPLICDRRPGPADGCSILLLAAGGGTATTLSDRLPVTLPVVASASGVLGTGSAWSSSRHVGREVRHPVYDAQPPCGHASSPMSGRSGMPGCSASSRHRRGHPAHQRPANQEKGRTMVDILHSVGVEASPDDFYSALTHTTDGSRPLVGDRHPGLPRQREAPIPASGWRGSDMSVLDFITAAGASAAGDRPARAVDRRARELGPQGRGRPDHGPVQAPGLEGAGGVHAPLQHQVGELPDEPEGAAGRLGPGLPTRASGSTTGATWGPSSCRADVAGRPRSVGGGLSPLVMPSARSSRATRISPMNRHAAAPAQAIARKPQAALSPPRAAVPKSTAVFTR